MRIPDWVDKGRVWDLIAVSPELPVFDCEKGEFDRSLGLNPNCDKLSENFDLICS